MSLPNLGALRLTHRPEAGTGVFAAITQEDAEAYWKDAEPTEEEKKEPLQEDEIEHGVRQIRDPIDQDGIPFGNENEAFWVAKEQGRDPDDVTNRNWHRAENLAEWVARQYANGQHPLLDPYKAPLSNRDVKELAEAFPDLNIPPNYDNETPREDMDVNDEDPTFSDLVSMEIDMERNLDLENADAALAAITQAMDRLNDPSFGQPPIVNVQEFQGQLNLNMCVYGAYLMVALCDPDRHLLSESAVTFYYTLENSEIRLTWSYDNLSFAFYADMMQSFRRTPQPPDDASTLFLHEDPLKGLVRSFQTLMTALIGRHNYQMAHVPRGPIEEIEERELSNGATVAADPNNSRIGLRTKYTFNVATTSSTDGLQLPYQRREQSEPRPGLLQRVWHLFGEDASAA